MKYKRALALLLCGLLLFAAFGGCAQGSPVVLRAVEVNAKQQQLLALFGPPETRGALLEVTVGEEGTEYAFGMVVYNGTEVTTTELVRGTVDGGKVLLRAALPTEAGGNVALAIAEGGATSYYSAPLKAAFPFSEGWAATAQQDEIQAQYGETIVLAALLYAEGGTPIYNDFSRYVEDGELLQNYEYAVLLTAAFTRPS